MILLLALFILSSTPSFAQTICGNSSEHFHLKATYAANKDSAYRSVATDLKFIAPAGRDTIADVGSYDGSFPLYYSIFTDSVVYYLNDVVPDGFTFFDSLKAICTKTKGQALNNEFHIVMGEETSTKLPTGLFNKVIIREALHHFSNKDEMLEDIKRIIKAQGHLFLFEPVKTPGMDQRNLCKGVMTREEFFGLMNRHGFKLAREGQNEETGWYEFRL